MIDGITEMIKRVVHIYNSDDYRREREREREREEKSHRHYYLGCLLVRYPSQNFLTFSPSIKKEK